MAKICNTFRDFYYHLYDRINFEFTQETGEKLKEYKDYEPDLLITFCVKYSNEKDILSQIAKLLSGLTTLQALPNANHRTAFRFIDLYLGFACGDNIKTYLEEKELYDAFYVHSKRIIDLDISHTHIFDESYHDAHNTMGFKDHLKHSKELLEKIVPAQSGMMEAVPFQRFITSLYQGGSSLNQTGTS